MSFGDEAVPEEGSAYSEAEAAEEAATDAAEAEHSSALAEEADPREQLARERDEYLLALQRTQADFENYRKRIGACRRSRRPGPPVTSSTRSCRCSTRSTWPRPT